MVNLPSLLSLECGCNISSAANSSVTVANVKVDSIKYVFEYTHCSVVNVFVVCITVLLLVLWCTRYSHFLIAELDVIVIRMIEKKKYLNVKTIQCLNYSPDESSICLTQN